MSDEFDDKTPMESEGDELNNEENLSEDVENEEVFDVEDVKQFEGFTSDLTNISSVTGMYQNWFLDYASYVILDRAVPHIDDGLKPVQRRVLHAMKRIDDGRYNKVAQQLFEELSKCLHTTKYLEAKRLLRCFLEFASQYAFIIF